MKEKYCSLIMLFERLHRVFLDGLKKELDRNGVTDINSIQCVILYNIGLNRLSIGEISNRGYYLGSNITYNLKKMIDNGYVMQEPSAHDRRSSYIKLSDKGINLYKVLDTFFDKHIENLPHNHITTENLKMVYSTLEHLESFWAFMSAREFMNRP